MKDLNETLQQAYSLIEDLANRLSDLDALDDNLALVCEAMCDELIKFKETRG